MIRLMSFDVASSLSTLFSLSLPLSPPLSLSPLSVDLVIMHTYLPVLPTYPNVHTQYTQWSRIFVASSQHTCYNRTDAWNTTPSIVVLKTDILTLHDQKTKKQKSVDGKCTKKNFVTWITRHTQNVAWLGAIILLFKPSVLGLNKLHVYIPITDQSFVVIWLSRGMKFWTKR